MKVISLYERHRHAKKHSWAYNWLKRMKSPATAYVTDQLFVGWRWYVRELGPGHWKEETPIHYATGDTLIDLLERLEKARVDILWHQAHTHTRIFSLRPEKKP